MPSVLDLRLRSIEAFRVIVLGYEEEDGGVVVEGVDLTRILQLGQLFGPALHELFMFLPSEVLVYQKRVTPRKALCQLVPTYVLLALALA